MTPEQRKIVEGLAAEQQMLAGLRDGFSQQKAAALRALLAERDALEAERNRLQALIDLHAHVIERRAALIRAAPAAEPRACALPYGHTGNCMGADGSQFTYGTHAAPAERWKHDAQSGAITCARCGGHHRDSGAVGRACECDAAPATCEERAPGCIGFTNGCRCAACGNGIFPRSTAPATERCLVPAACPETQKPCERECVFGCALRPGEAERYIEESWGPSGRH